MTEGVERQDQLTQEPQEVEMRILKSCPKIIIYQYLQVYLIN